MDFNDLTKPLVLKGVQFGGFLNFSSSTPLTVDYTTPEVFSTNFETPFYLELLPTEIKGIFTFNLYEIFSPNEYWFVQIGTASVVSKNQLFFNETDGTQGILTSSCKGFIYYRSRLDEGAFIQRSDNLKISSRKSLEKNVRVISKTKTVPLKCAK